MMVLRGRQQGVLLPILDQHAWAAVLFARHLHEERLRHVGGPGTLLAELRTELWVLGAKKLCKRTCSKCVACRRLAPIAATQLQGLLPKSRLAQEAGQRVFSHILVDLFGPRLIKQEGRRPAIKRWVMVFVCAGARAIHLEPVQDKSTEAIISALTRFASRRTIPKEITSDNAAEFVAVGEHLSTQNRRSLFPTGWENTVWKHYPPLAPHWGGSVEAAVKLAKTALDHLVQNRDLGDYELLTALAAAEDLLNRRPLAEDSDSTLDPPVITPAALLGGGNALASAVDWSNPQSALRQGWFAVEANLRHMWDRLQKEVIPTLLTRTKWTKEKPDIKEGDIVLVLDLPTMNHFKWPAARVLSTTKGRDGHVRRVVVRCGGKNYERAITSIAPLF